MNSKQVSQYVFLEFAFSSFHIHHLLIDLNMSCLAMVLYPAQELLAIVIFPNSLDEFFDMDTLT